MFWKKKEAPQEAPLRPCEVDGMRCLFHRFVDEDKALLKIDVFLLPHEQRAIVAEFKEAGIVPKCCSTEALRSTFALVEYPDGSLGKVDPMQVCFTDKGR